MVYEIDFLPVNNASVQRSGIAGAITVRLTVEGDDRNAIVVINGGDTLTGHEIVNHVRKYYDSNAVDLAIATKPDADHLTGLGVVLAELDVAELLVHQAGRHGGPESTAGEFDPLERVLGVARDRGTTVTEPFTGVFRVNGQIAVLGPSQSFYEGLVTADPGDSTDLSGTRLLDRAVRRIRAHLLVDRDDRPLRGDTSVVALIQAADHRLLFAGDAGPRTLEQAVDFYESWYGDFASMPLHFFQAPYHVDPTRPDLALLDRILGSPNAPYGDQCVAFIVSPGGEMGHAAPRLVKALGRRGCAVRATEGRAACHSVGGPPRPDWLTLPPVLPTKG